MFSKDEIGKMVKTVTEKPTKELNEKLMKKIEELEQRIVALEEKIK